MWQFWKLLIVELKKILTYLLFHLSKEFNHIKSATKRHKNTMLTLVYFMHNKLHDEQILIGVHVKQNLDGDKNNPRISSLSNKFTVNTSLSWKEYFTVLRELLGPVELDILIFFQKSTNQHGTEQSLTQNMAMNSHSVEYETLWILEPFCARYKATGYW